VLKRNMGIKNDDVVLGYAGSTAPWQSFELLEKMFVPLLEKDKRIKLLFLSKETEGHKKLAERFPGNVLVKWVEHQQVLTYLSCCDYGVLVREQSDTNKVASPVKFAEYLYAGLPVLISEGLGDFSGFVSEQKCGDILPEDSSQWPQFPKTGSEEKERCNKLAREFFYKESEPNSKAYSELIHQLKSLD